MDRRSLVLSILLAVCFLSATNARTLEYRQQTTSSSTQSTGQAETSCGFKGTPDMYGLGIRLGIYLQTLAVLLAGTFDKTGSMMALSLAGSLFKLSMLLGLSILTATHTEFQVVEAAIVIAFTLCTHETINIEHKSTKSRWKYLPIMVHSANIAIGSYSIWFWFRGIDQLAHSICPSYGFFFSRVTFLGWFRTFGKVFSILQFLVLLLLLVLVNSKINLKCDGIEPGMLRNIAKVASKIVPWLWSICCILAIELMIRWNHIGEVNSISNVGQAIPFLVGFGSVVTVIIEWTEEHDSPRNELLQVFVVGFITLITLAGPVVAIILVGAIVIAIVGAIAYVLARP
ncbi:hypothetical protein BDD12DRAFT_227983 [Trichophaea hybrida]|nr:hypothetical protein BDD12DRAFT_227983 [Trichophaea hybrida]